MSLLTRDAILKVSDLKTETVEVPEWGGSVKVRALKGSERDAFEQSLFVGDGDARKFSGDNVRAKLLVRCLVDDAGKRLFEDSEAAALGERNAAALDRLYDAAQKLSGIGKADLERAVKN